MVERNTQWGEYYEHHQGRAPRPELMQLLDAMRQDGESFEGKTALEIGTGNMIETKALLDAGFGHVIATDITDGAENAAASLQLDVNDFGHDVERLEFLKVANEELAAHLEHESIDLAVAYLSLQFTPPEDFARLWVVLRESLKPGGKLSVILIGNRDDWARKTLADGSRAYKKMNFHSREDIEKLLTDFDSIQVREEEEDGKTHDGVAKHWHTFYVEAQKPNTV
ncbi:methyltransferase domain-containing protein [bacterium]|nr:MAG: methyltransferase domain-containing protein [bacterium]